MKEIISTITPVRNAVLTTIFTQKIYYIIIGLQYIRQDMCTLYSAALALAQPQLLLQMLACMGGYGHGLVCQRAGVH